MCPSSAARQLFDRFREGLHEPTQPAVDPSQPAAAAVAAPVTTAVNTEPVAVAPTPPPAPTPEPELPRSSIVGRIQLPTYPAAAVAEARETLEEILKDIQDMRPDFSLMSPRYQKAHMLAWISRARSFDEQFQGGTASSRRHE